MIDGAVDHLIGGGLGASHGRWVRLPHHQTWHQNATPGTRAG